MVIRAVQIARKGRGPTDSAIFEDDADLLVQNAAQMLSDRVAQDERRRHLLRKDFVITLVNGVGTLVGAAYEGILHSALQWASFYDPDDVNDDTLTHPYVFKREAQDLHKYLNPNYGYWAFLAPLQFETRARNIADVQASRTALNGNGQIRANYTFDFSGNFPLPTGGELDNEACEALAEMLVLPAGAM